METGSEAYGVGMETGSEAYGVGMTQDKQSDIRGVCVSANSKYRQTQKT
jgi:predicted nucleotidyltransferase